MKKFVIFFIFLFPIGVLSYASPGRPTGFVNDFANIISPTVRADLENKLSGSGLEIAVVTVSTLGDETIETYAVKLFEEWGIGNEEKDNGVLFLIAPTERQVRIEVGYGLEGVLTDAQSNGIIQKIVIPEFKNNNLEEGIVKGSEAIIAVVSSEADYSQAKEENSIGGSIFIFIWFILAILINIFRRTKSWWLGGVVGGIGGIIIGFIFGFIFIGIISIVGLTLLGLLFDYIVSKHGGKGGTGGFFGGFGGGHGGGSDFGGFGGGMSGGGGSSGRW